MKTSRTTLKEKPQPKKQESRTPGYSKLRDSSDDGTLPSCQARPHLPTLSFPHSTSQLCQPPDGSSNWMLWHSRKPTHWVTGDTQDWEAPHPTHLAALSHPCQTQGVVIHHREPQIRQYRQLTGESYYQRRKAPHSKRICITQENNVEAVNRKL